jgi:hypothetical protein
MLPKTYGRISLANVGDRRSHDLRFLMWGYWRHLYLERREDLKFETARDRFK